MSEESDKIKHYNLLLVKTNGMEQMIPSSELPDAIRQALDNWLVCQGYEFEET